MARSTSSSPTPPADAPPPATDESAALRAKIAELEQQKIEQTQQYRRRLEEIQTEADEKAAEVKRLAEQQQRIKDDAKAEIEAAALAAAGDENGRRWKVTPPLASGLPTVVLSAPTSADARQRFLRHCGATETTEKLRIDPSDEAISPTGKTHFWDHPRQQWSPRDPQKASRFHEPAEQLEPAYA